MCTPESQILQLMRSNKEYVCYQAALEHVSDPDTRAKLSFNLGLGYLRWDKPDVAVPWFEQAADLTDRGFEKAAKYMQLAKKKMGSRKPVDKPVEKPVEQAPPDSASGEKPAVPADNTFVAAEIRLDEEEEFEWDDIKDM